MMSFTFILMKGRAWNQYKYKEHNWLSKNSVFDSEITHEENSLDKCEEGK